MKKEKEQEIPTFRSITYNYIVSNNWVNVIFKNSGMGWKRYTRVLHKKCKEEELFQIILTCSLYITQEGIEAEDFIDTFGAMGRQLLDTPRETREEWLKEMIRKARKKK